MMRQVIGLFAVVLAACSSDNGGGGGTAAQRSGIGAACATNADCVESAPSCLAFKGGYCGVMGCSKNTDCPSGSACVAHSDGKNYCFLQCVDKIDCNATRPAGAEANCSSTATFTDKSTSGKKACVPPS